MGDMETKIDNTLFDYLYLPNQTIGSAVYLIKTLGRYAMRLPNWGEDIALFYCKKSERLIWTHYPSVDVELLGYEILSQKWEIWRLK